MHHIDRNTPWEEIWQAMEQLVREGKVLYVGSSNFAGWHIAQAQGEAQKRHFMGLVSEQSLYNLATRTIEMEVIPACREYGLALIPWSPMEGGLLERRSEKSEGGAAKPGADDEADRETPKQLEKYESLCKKSARSRRMSRWPGCCTILR